MNSLQDVSRSNSAHTDHHHRRTLCEELWNMCTEGVLCDAVLEVGGEQLRVHRVVLSACSPYLKQCCVNPDSITPCGSASIRINTYSYKVCLKAIEYLYTGKVEVLKEQHLMEEFNQLCQEWGLLNLTLVGGSRLMHAFCLESTCSTTPTKETPVLGDEHSLQSKIQTANYPENTATDPPKAVSTRSTRGRRRKSKTVNKSSKYSKRTLTSTCRLCPLPETTNSLESKDGNTHSDHHEEANTSVIRVKPDEDKKENCDSIGCDNNCDNADKGNSVDGNCNDNIKDSSTQEDNEDVGSKADSHGDHSQEKLQSNPNAITLKKEIRCNPTIETSSRQKSKLREEKSPKPWLFKKNSCQSCTMVFTSREEWLAHRKKEHPKLRKMWCELCKMRFPDSNLLQLHNMEHHWTEGMKLAKKYVCTEPGCSFSSFIYATWHKHKNLHHAEPRVCEICGKTLKNEFTLKQHVENLHTRTTAYPCDVCNRTFSTKGNLKAHMEARHMEKTTREKLVCPQCAFVCWCKPSMSEHILLKHNELMPARNLHQCESCDFKTTIRTKMKEHMRSHSVVERLACSVCGKTYKSVKLLNRHKKMHNNTAKVTKCTYCDYTTLHGVGTLSNHLRFKHKDRDPKPWRCDECSHKAISKESLVHHLLYVHKRDFDTYTSTVPTEPVGGRNLTDENSFERTISEKNQVLPTSSEHVANERTQTEGSAGSTAIVSSGPYHNLLAAQIPVSVPLPDIATSMHAPIPGLLPGGLLNTHGQALYSSGMHGSLATGPQGYTPLPQGYMQHEGMVNPMYTHNMGF